MGFKAGDVVRYADGSLWCIHGIAVVHESGGEMWATDTYWNDRESTVPLDRLEGKELLGIFLPFRRSVSYPYQYEDYSDTDKFYIPIGGGSSQSWVRTNTHQTLKKLALRLRYELQKAHDKVQSAARAVEWSTKQLMKFEFQQEEYAPKAVMAEVQKMDEIETSNASNL